VRALERLGVDTLAAALSVHRVPQGLTDRMLAAAATIGAEDAVLGLAGALDAEFGFKPFAAETETRPLLLLGDARLGQGNYPGALESYSQAVQVSRVSDGLFSPSQVEAVYKQSEALQRLGDGEDATRREEYAYEVLARAHGTQDEAMLPGVFRLARWYKNAYNIFAARALYQQALKIHEANGKAGTPQAIPALQGLAETYRMERFPPFYVDDRESGALIAARPSGRFANYDMPLQINSFPVAEQALQTVIRIRQEAAGSGPTPVSEANLDLADWHLMWEHFREAHTL